jgi:hypothetical protein
VNQTVAPCTPFVAQRLVRDTPVSCQTTFGLDELTSGHAEPAADRTWRVRA